MDTAGCRMLFVCTELRVLLVEFVETSYYYLMLQKISGNLN